MLCLATAAFGRSNISQDAGRGGKTAVRRANFFCQLRHVALAAVYPYPRHASGSSMPTLLESFLASARHRDSGEPALSWTAVLLVLLAIATRLQILGDPLADSDEGYYLLVGEHLLHGAVPYVDIWDRKPVGLFLLYAGMRWLGGDGVIAYQLAGTLAAFLTALLVMRLARQFTNAFGAAAAGAAYVLWLPLGSAAGGQAELFANLPITAAALITLRGLEQPSAVRCRTGGMSALLLVGIAMQIKYTALFAGIFLGCCWLVAGWRVGWRAGLVAFGAMLNVAALAPTLLAIAWYAAHGHLDAFLYANFTSAWQRAVPSILHQSGALVIALILAPLLACIRPRAVLPAAGRIAYRFTLGWLLAATVGLIAYRTYLQQFLLPLLMPASAAAAPTFGRIPARRTVALLGVILVLGQCDLWISRIVHGSRREAAAIVRAVDPQGCLYIYSGVAALYRLTGACIPTKYAFPSLLSRTRESGAIGVDPVREVARIMGTRPGTVLVRSAYEDENWRARAVVEDVLRHAYHLVLREQLGQWTVSVYRLGNASRDRSRGVRPDSGS